MSPLKLRSRSRCGGQREADLQGAALLTPWNRLINSGCPNNVPAGHYPNMDKVMEHYRKQHLDDEERKAKKLAQSKNA